MLSKYMEDDKPLPPCYTTRIWCLDCSDEGYPRIVIRVIAKSKLKRWAGKPDVYFTWKEAKEALIDACREPYEHWRDRLRDARKITKKELES